jgi:cobalamin biosynthesis Mg chelatase CobN
MIQPEEIHVGPANIYIDVTPPATAPDVDSEPSWLPHLNGVPSSGVHVGATLGDSVFTWTTTKTDIVAEQVMGILDKFISDQMASLTFEAEERTMELMVKTFDNIGNVHNAVRKGFWGGGGGTTLNILYTTIALTSLRKDIAGAYEVLCVYKCVSTAPMPLTYSRTKPSTYQCTFAGLPDTTRTEGDQIFQFSREEAANTFGSASKSPSASPSSSASASKSPSSSASPS